MGGALTPLTQSCGRSRARALGIVDTARLVRLQGTCVAAGQQGACWACVVVVGV